MNPPAVTEVPIAVAFWVGVAATGFWIWTWYQAARASVLTSPSGGDRRDAGTTEDTASDAGARSGSTR
jgi:hypothetical protein